MNIDQMHFFTVVAQMENVSKAADSLHMTQSTLSKNILRLEEELGVPLFDRHGKKLFLNEQGSRFLDTCRKTLQEVTDAREEMRRSLGNPEKKIRIAVCGGLYKIFQCMIEFQKQNPDATFDVDTQAEYEEYLDINAYDVAIYPDENRFRKFRGYDFGEEVLLLARAEKLVAPKHYVFMQINGRTEFAYQFFSSISDPNISFCFVNSGGAHLQMITSGLAQGFVPEEMKEMHKDGRVLLFPAPNDKFVRKMKICFKRERRLSPMAASFCAFTKEYFKLSTADLSQDS